MSRRARAIAFAIAAALCAGLAAGATGSGESGAQLGPLRGVLVATRPLPAHRPIDAATARRSFELRRVPERFLPPGALTSPAQAIGRSPAIPLAPGGYVLGSELREPRSREDPGERRLGSGRHPVEIAVTGAGPLAQAGAAPGSTVDVIVTAEAGAPGAGGRTYVAAADVELLDLRAADDSGSGALPGGAITDHWLATLGLTRGQALRLIHAQSFASDVRLISH